MPSNLIGNIKDFSSELKQQALFFDQIGIYDAKWVLRKLRNGPLYEQHRDWLNSIDLELEWLKSENVVIDLDDASIDAGYLARIGSSDHWLKVNENNIEMGDLINQVQNQQNVGIDKFVNALLKSDALKLRLMALGFTNSKETTAYSSLELKDFQYEFPEAQKTNVVSLVLKNLPLPSGDTPWEKIIEYRSDPDSRKNLLNLRRWISKITSTNLSNSEIEDEIEGLINDYQDHLKFHKMKADTIYFQSLVTLPFELIENLLKIRISKLPEPFFALQKRKLSLFEAELTAPGKELTYIIKSNDEFSNPD